MYHTYNLSSAPNKTKPLSTSTHLYHTVPHHTVQHWAAHGRSLSGASTSNTSKQALALASTQLSPQGQRSAPCGQYGGQPLPLFLFREIDNFPLRLHMNQTRLRKLIPINIDIWWVALNYATHVTCVSWCAMWVLFIAAVQVGLIKVDPQFDPKLSRVGASFILIFGPKIWRSTYKVLHTEL